jgi:hypothetical protein
MLTNFCLLRADNTTSVCKYRVLLTAMLAFKNRNGIIMATNKAFRINNVTHD